MLFRLLPLLFLLISGKVFAREAPIDVFEYVDNVKIVAFIKESDINKELHWHPFKSAPPLSIGKALTGIHKYIAKKPELANATLAEIELKEIPQNKGYWHYIVKLNAKTSDKLQAYYFVVLMDGKIFPAMKEPESFK